MRLFTIICVLLASCTSTGEAATVVEPLATLVPVCRDGPSSLEAATDSAPEMVLLAVGRAKANDLRCGPPSRRIRTCRALFVLSVVDPANSLNKPEVLASAHEAVSWVLQDAASVADDSTLAAALLQLDELNDHLVAAADDDTRAQILQQRANPAVLDPIEAAWTRCE